MKTPGRLLSFYANGKRGALREELESRVNLSVKVPSDLHQEIVKLVQAENCRSYKGFVVYFLEAMVEVVRRDARYRLRISPANPPRTAHFRFDISKGLFESLEESGRKYGMKVSEITRVFSGMGLEAYKKCLKSGEIVSKEELIECLRGRLAA